MSFSLAALALAALAPPLAGAPDPLPLASFDRPEGRAAGFAASPTPAMAPGAPAIDTSDGAPPPCASFPVDCSLSGARLALGALPVTPAPTADRRFVRLKLKMPRGVFYRLGVLPAGADGVAFTGVQGTAAEVRYDGPWGTRAVSTSDDWVDAEIDLDWTVPAIDRSTFTIGAVCVEAYGPGAPYAAWGGARERIVIKVDEITLRAQSIVPGVGEPRAAPHRDLPLLAGFEAHGAQTIRTGLELGLGNFVWIPSHNYVVGKTPWNEEHTVWNDIQACVAGNAYFWVSGRRGLGDRFRAGGQRTGGHGSGEWYKPADYRRMQLMAGRHFVGALAEELDADLLQENWRPMFRARLPEILDYADAAGGRASFESELERQRRRYHGLGVPYLASLCVTHHHSGFRAGADMVIAELFEHLPATELQLAYLRGGAQTWDRPWGVWISPWYKGTIPNADQGLWPAPQAQEGGGHTASMFRRALYLSYVSGARVLAPQNTEHLWRRGDDGEPEAALWGKELQAFWAYAREHSAPMEPVSSLAILIDEDNGWEPAHLWGGSRPVDTVWSILPARRFEEGMYRAYLDALLPGFRRTPESVEAHRGDVFPGYFAATPLGPFDIVPADAAAETLTDYPAVVMLGGFRMDVGLAQRLREYVRRGGTLLLNACQLFDGARLVQCEDVLGLRVESAIEAANAVEPAADVPGVGRDRFDGPWFTTVSVEPRGAETVATDGGAQGRPVLLRHRFGQGTVYFAAVEHMCAGYGERVEALPFFVRLMKGLAQKGPLSVAGRGETISWTVARQEGDLVAALANHGDKPAAARLTPAALWDAPRMEAGSGRVRRGGGGLWVDIPPEDVALLRFAPK